MLERIQLIDNVGNYINTNPAAIQFNRVNLIYGENRNGKSTLCDIFFSLASNDPQLIIDRKSIVTNQQANQNEQIIKMKFYNHQQSIIFKNNSWTSSLPSDSKIYVFDHGFIHRNVMTGINYTRENSENMSGFILGANATKFKILEEKNQNLRDDRKNLTEIKRQIEEHDIENFSTFINLPLPPQSLDEVNREIEKSQQNQVMLKLKISNIDKILNRKNLEDIHPPINIGKYLEDVNKCLISNMQNVHEASKALLSAHKHKLSHIDINSFDGWAFNGLKFFKDNCPFCGQNIDQVSSLLIQSYQQAFNTSFEEFVNSTKATVNYLLDHNPILIDLMDLEKHHQTNLNFIDVYTEDEVQDQVTKYLLTPLKEKFQDVHKTATKLKQIFDKYRNLIKGSLKIKVDAPYNPVNEIDFSNLTHEVNTYKNEMIAYNQAVSAINMVLNHFKDSLKLNDLTKNLTQEIENEKKFKISSKRIALNQACLDYKNLKAKSQIDQKNYDLEKQNLENDQEIFLNKYFNEINTLFKATGSSDFEISRSLNRGGTRTVYDLDVKFKGCSIDKNKLHCLFSESDRRALALCIFLAKIHRLSSEDKEKAIIILDDPVTSFDNERINSILRILFSLESSIKQIIITTHYKGMASLVMKKFQDVQAMKIIKSMNGSTFQKATKEEMTATAHDERYTEIMDFIECRTQDDKFTKLRPFIEDEMRHRYKKCLSELGLNNKNSFGECIDALNHNHFIPNDVAESLHEFRTTLNRPAHELELQSIDDSRTYAKQMMDFIYSKL